MDIFQKTAWIKDFMYRSGLNYQEAENIYDKFVAGEKEEKLNGEINKESGPTENNVEYWQNGKVVERYD